MYYGTVYTLQCPQTTGRSNIHMVLENRTYSSTEYNRVGLHGKSCVSELCERVGGEVVGEVSQGDGRARLLPPFPHTFCRQATSTLAGKGSTLSTVVGGEGE